MMRVCFMCIYED